MKKKIIICLVILLVIMISIITVYSTVKATSSYSGQEEVIKERITTTSSRVEFSESTTANGIVNIGDVNGDEKINASDAAIILQYAAIQGVEWKRPTDKELLIADINKDQSIDASDAALILLYAAGEGAGNLNGNTINENWTEFFEKHLDE